MLTKPIFFAQKPIVLAKMLIQGPLGLELHIYQKPDHPRSFSILNNVDGGIKS